MILIQGTGEIRILEVPQDHMELGGVGMVVDQILTAHRIVLAPVEVELLELVAQQGLLHQRASPHHGHRILVVGQLHQHRVPVVCHLETFGLHVEIQELKLFELLLHGIDQIDVNGTLVLAAAAGIVLAPVLGSMSALVSKVLGQDNRS